MMLLHFKKPQKEAVEIHHHYHYDDKDVNTYFKNKKQFKTLAKEKNLPNLPYKGDHVHFKDRLRDQWHKNESSSFMKNFKINYSNSD